MLRLSRFAYLAPRSVEEARALLIQHGDGAVLMAGGTDVLVNIKHRLITPALVIGIRELPGLRDFAHDQEGWLSIGAGTPLARVERDPRVSSAYPALRDAVHAVSTPQVRAIGTIGGNVCLDTRCNYYNQSYEWRKGIGFCMKKDSPICRVAPGGDRCWAVSSADSVPALIALRAEVSVLGSSGVRRMPLESLYVDDGLLPMALRPGEIVLSIHLPPAGEYHTAYRKFRIRGSFDFPLVGIATTIHRDRAGIITDARVVTTAVASRPERAGTCEQALIGQPLNELTIERAGALMYRQARPMDNTAGTIFHRKRMARVLLERALRDTAVALAR